MENDTVFCLTSFDQNLVNLSAAALFDAIIMYIYLKKNYSSLQLESQLRYYERKLKKH